jgi:hypothetical protein
MKTKLILILLAFSVSNNFAQTDSLRLEQRITILEKQIVNQQEQLNNFYKELAKDYWTYRGVRNQVEEKYSKQDRTIDSLQKIIDSNATHIQTAANELGVKIEDTHKFTNQSITDLNKTVSQNTLYWIIAILVVALLVLLVFVFLRKQIFKQKTDLDSNLQDTRKALEEEGVKLDIKLAEMLEKQLIIIHEKRNKETKNIIDTIDHSLVLTIADRLISMERNLSNMDEKTRGLNFLKRAILSIKDNFASNGYEIVEMIGKPYHTGMKAEPTFDPDSTAESGTIIQIIKPQVNYKGVMIQSAQIIVSE